MQKLLVTNLNTLQKLEKSGNITLHPHTGKDVYWYGQKVKAWYIDDYVNCSFGNYVVEYRDGCFNPFVFKIVK